MNTAPVYGEAGFDARLSPTWRLLWTRIRAFNGPRANLRAERLVMRAVDRGWPADRLERYLARVIERERGPRAEREREAMEAFLEVGPALDPFIDRWKATYRADAHPRSVA